MNEGALRRRNASSDPKIGVVRDDDPIVADRMIQDLVVGGVGETDLANCNRIVAFAAQAFSEPWRQVGVDEESHPR